MIVVSNKLHILTFLKLNQLELLNKLYEKVVVPNHVYDELIKTIENEENLMKILNNSNFISKVDIDQNKVKELQSWTGMHQGVVEALVYGVDMKDCAIFVDNLEQIGYVQNAGLIYKRCIDVLYEAYVANFISFHEAFQYLDIMIENGISFTKSSIEILKEQIGYDKYNEYKKQIGKDRDLFEIAVGDLKSAKSLYKFYIQKNEERCISRAAFHLQQALEKCIKSISIGNDMGANHDINTLILKAKEIDKDLLLSDYLIKNAKLITSWDEETLQDYHDYKVESDKVKEAFPYIEEYLKTISKEVFKMEKAI